MALLKLVLLLILLIVLLRRGWLLGSALLLASLICGLFQGCPPVKILLVGLHTLQNTQNWLLICIILSVLILAHSMSKTNYAEKLITYYQGLFPSAVINLMSIPAFIGLLPMPGGAIFSAPLVERMAQKFAIPRNAQAVINYWFRHCFEFSWPLYPGLILAAHLSGIDLFNLIGHQVIFTILGFIIGYLFFLRNITATTSFPKAKWRPFIKQLLPLLVVIVLAVINGKLLKVPREIGIGIGVWIGIIWIWIQEKITLKQLKQVFLEKTLLKVLFAVLGIFVFKQMLNESQIVIQAGRDLVRLHVPIVLITAALPFLVGLIIGLTLAFVGVTFPLIINLIHFLHLPLMPYTVLAFVSGVIGVFLSPMHLCLILSLEYFKVGFNDAYHKLYYPCALMLLAAFIWFAILKFLPGLE